jgi:hypothetical protein
VFWTVPVPDDAITVDVAAGTARFAMSDYAIPDRYNFPNALVMGPSEPAHVTFDMRWFGPGQRFSLDNPDQAFAGDFVDTKVSIDWSSANDSGMFSFQSDPTEPSQSLFGVLGTERNGFYYVNPPQTATAPPAARPSPQPAPAVQGGRLPATGGTGWPLWATAAGAGAVLLRRLRERGSGGWARDHGH